MNKVKIGDFVYYKCLNKEGLIAKSGIVINVNENNVSILVVETYNKCIKNIDMENIFSLGEKEDLIIDIKNFYNDMIKKQESLIKSVKRSDYKEEIKNEYLLLKEEILNTCANMSKDIDDYEFENKLKAICQKKKQLFSIKYEEMNEARKFNGEIKYRVKELKNELDYNLKNLDYSITILNEYFKEV